MIIDFIKHKKAKEFSDSQADEFVSRMEENNSQNIEMFTLIDLPNLKKDMSKYIYKSLIENEKDK